MTVTANTMNPICIGSASAGAKSDSTLYFSFCCTEQWNKSGDGHEWALEKAPVPARLDRGGHRLTWKERRRQWLPTCMEGGLKITMHFFHCPMPFLHLKTEEYESNEYLYAMRHIYNRHLMLTSDSVTPSSFNEFYASESIPIFWCEFFLIFLHHDVLIA